MKLIKWTQLKKDVYVYYKETSGLVLRIHVHCFQLLCCVILNMNV